MFGVARDEWRSVADRDRCDEWIASADWLSGPIDGAEDMTGKNRCFAESIVDS